MGLKGPARLVAPLVRQDLACLESPGVLLYLAARKLPKGQDVLERRQVQKVLEDQMDQMGPEDQKAPEAQYSWQDLQYAILFDLKGQLSKRLGRPSTPRMCTPTRFVNSDRSSNLF